jgi:hypothetical protein
LVGAAAVVYAWWATGVPPFTTRSYVAVGLPVAMVGAASLTRWPTTRASPHHDRGQLSTGLVRALPWLAIAAAAAGLEAAALAAGGRSTAVPTLSTVVDHGLGHHAARWALFLAWLVIGSAPSVRARRDGGRGDMTCW